MALKALFLILLAFTGASGLMYMWFRDSYYLRWCGVAVLITTAAFMTGDYFVVAVIVLLIAFTMRRQEPVDKISAWLFLLPLLPVAWSYLVPMPGVSYLLELNYPRLLLLFFLVPLLLYQWRSSQPSSGKNEVISLLDWFVLINLIYVCLLEFRQDNITSSMRVIIYDLMLIGIPYMVISRGLRSMDDFYLISRTLMYSGLMFAVLATVSEIFKFNPHLSLHSSYMNEFRIASFSDMRWGLLRITATMYSPIVLGYFFILAAGFLYMFKGFMPRGVRVIPIGLILLLLGLGMLFTISRGVWLSFTVVSFAILYFRVQHVSFRFMFPFAGLIIIVFYFMGALPGIHDEYGTFDFRASLFEVSLLAFQDNPVFGSEYFRDNPIFLFLALNDGFIDFVNSYMTILLESGLVGLIFYLMVPVLALTQIYIALGKKHVANNRAATHAGVALFAMIAGTLVLFATVSQVTFIPLYYWILIGLSSAWIRCVNLLSEDDSLKEQTNE